MILTTKKCRIYAALGVSQTPIYSKGKEECNMDDIIKALTIIWLIIQIADRLSDILDDK